MKRIFVIGLIALILLLSSHSSTPSLELIKANVQIVTDKNVSGSIGIMQGDKEIGMITPTVLQYTFILKNTGSWKLGDINNRLLGVKINPSGELVSVLNETIGKNIFDVDGGMGWGMRFTSQLWPGEQGKFSIHYILGAKTENPELPLVPSYEKLSKLENSALSGTLNVILGDEKIGSFDLLQFKNTDKM